MSVAEITAMLTKDQTSNKKGIRISDYASDYVYQGKAYSISKRITVLAATNTIILFDYSSMTRSFSLYTPTYDTTTGPLEIDYYLAPDYVNSTGTEIPALNRAAFGPPSQATIYYGALSDFTGTTKGTKFTEGLSCAGHKEGGTTQSDIEYIPPQKNKILIEIDNTNGTDATVLIRGLWFEV